MPIDLPEPTSDNDVWGLALNTAISAIETAAAVATAAANAAAATVAASFTLTNVDSNSIDLIQPNGASHTVVTWGGSNSIYGFAGLDGFAQVPLRQLGNIGYIDVGAAAASHQHSLSDIPGINLSVNASPLIARFAGGVWPFRTTLTSSPTQCVIWMGDADVPTYAIPGVDLYFGPRRSGTTQVTPTPPAPPTATPDANSITLTAPTVTVSGSTFNITANVTTASSRTFTYLQLAVRGPSGENLDTGYNNDAVVNTTTLTVAGSGNATATGTWSVALAYNLTGGGAQGDWVDGPATTFTISSLGGVPTAPGTGVPGSGAVPVLGRSGLAWNSGVFFDAGSVTSATQFFNWRNRAGDAIMYFVGRGQWSELTWMRDDLTSWPGYRIVSLPSQPAGQNNSATAAGSNNSFWTQYGLLLKNKGWDDGRTVLRLNWEANGNWYDWSWMYGGAAQFVNAYKNVVNSVRVHAPKTKFLMNMNRDSDYDGTNWQTQIMDPLIGYVDIIGLDSYDHAPAQTNDSSWNSTVAQDPGLTSIAAYCRAKGVMMSLDEWGSSLGQPGSYTGGGDNPYYMGKMWDWMVANSDVLAIETYYNDDGAPSTLRHKIYPATNNPNMGAIYKATSRWGKA